MSNISPQIRVLVADRHKLFREGLKLLLEVDPSIRVIAEASDSMEVVELTRTLKPDVVLLDYSFPRSSAIETLQLIGRLSSSTRTLILISKAGEFEILELLQGGASGFVLKESSSQLLRKSIHAVMAGQYWITRQGIANLVRELMQEPRNPAMRTVSPNWGLTLRENQIIAEIVAGSTNKQIAETLNLSEQTVKHHLTSIFDKVGASSRLELALMVSHFAVNQNESILQEEPDSSQRNLLIGKMDGNGLSVAPTEKPLVYRNSTEDADGNTEESPSARTGQTKPERRSLTG